MTNTEITTVLAADAFKSKQNFSEFINKNYEDYANELLKDYEPRSLRIVAPQMTPNADGLVDALKELKDSDKCYVLWFIANEKPDMLKFARKLNKIFTKDCGIFIIKAVLNGDEMEYECLLKPSIENKTAPAKLIRNVYWKRYFEVADEKQSELQITPEDKYYVNHFQYISINKKNVTVVQTINTVKHYVATELMIRKQDIFDNLYQNKEQIEEKLGSLIWQPLEDKDCSRIRKVLELNPNDEEVREQAIAEHIKLAEDFKAVFSEYLQ